MIVSMSIVIPAEKKKIVGKKRSRVAWSQFSTVPMPCPGWFILSFNICVERKGSEEWRKPFLASGGTRSVPMV